MDLCGIPIQTEVLNGYEKSGVGETTKRNRWRVNCLPTVEPKPGDNDLKSDSLGILQGVRMKTSVGKRGWALINV